MLVWACPVDVQVDVLHNCWHCVCDCMLCERTGYVPLTITGEAVGEVKNFKFLGTTISCDLKWVENISAATPVAFLPQTTARIQSESILTFFTIVGYSSVCPKDRD